MSYPQAYKLNLSTAEHSPDYVEKITRILGQNPDCIQVLAPPVISTKARNGRRKWRQCTVEIRDEPCHSQMEDALRRAGIHCKARRI